LKRSLGDSNGRGGNIEVFEMRVPTNKCGLIIGKGGETIKRLGEQYGVKLIVVQETTAAVGADKPLRITGEPEKVARARAAVEEMINPTEEYNPNRNRYNNGGYQTNDYGSRGGDRNGSEATVKVPGDKAGIVIGKGLNLF
jgi:far upstream element-binding protein